MSTSSLLEVVVRINCSTNGRDKSLRFVLFFQTWSSDHFYPTDWLNSRLVSYGPFSRKKAYDSLQPNSWKKHWAPEEKVIVWCRIDVNNNSSLSALQLGRFIDLLYSARESVRLNDDMLRITLTMSKIASALFIAVDNLLWLSRVGVCNINRREWFLTSCRLWLYSILMNLIRDWFELKRRTERRIFCASFVSGKREPVIHSESQSPVKSVQELCSLVKQHPDLAVDFCKNSCDFLIPMSALNYCPLSPKTIGFLGLISSLCALAQLADPSLRLNPS